MSPSLTNALAAAESLSIEERRELVELLLDGLAGTPEAAAPELSEAWRQEIARRSAEYDAGRSAAVPWDDVRSRWQARRAAGG